jgi:O-antigen ligase
LDTSFNQSMPGEPWPAAPRADRRSRWLTLLDRIIFYGLIAIIVLTAVPYGTVDPWSEALFECAVFFLALLWTVHGFIDGSWRIGNTRLIAPMAVLVIFAVVQSLAWWQVDWSGEKVWFALSSDPFESRVFAFRVAALVIVTILAVRFTSSTTRLGILVHAIIAVALASTLFGIARQTMQHGQGFGLSRLSFESGYAQFINKNHFAFLVEVALALLIGVAIMRRRRHQYLLLYLSAMVLMWAAVVLSRSRGGLLAITVQTIFAGLLFVNSRRSKTESRTTKSPSVRWARSIAATTIMVGALLLIVGAGVVWLGGDQLVTGVETATAEMASTDVSVVHEGARRRDIWRATWLMFKAHPIAGAGLGGFWVEAPVFHEASGAVTPQQAHNDYLELLASGGILGAALFIWFAVALIRQARESINGSEGFQRAVTLGAVIGMVGVGVHSMVDFGLHITSNAAVFVVLLAIISLKRLAVRTTARKGGR